MKFLPTLAIVFGTLWVFYIICFLPVIVFSVHHSGLSTALQPVLPSMAVLGAFAVYQVGAWLLGSTRLSLLESYAPS